MHDPEKVKVIVQQSRTLRECLIKLGLRGAGGNYESFRRFCSKHNISVAHFRRGCWNAGVVIGPKRPLEVYLSNSARIGSHSLKLRLISEGVKERKCERCGITEWQGSPAPLELEHVDGNHSNNELSNLLILCPNCHALTPTYRGRNTRLKARTLLEHTEVSS